MPLQPASPAAPPVLSIPGNRAQRRWTVLIRLVLIIPAVIWLELLSIVGFFAAVAAWLAALVTGRVPEGIATFLDQILDLFVRTNAYVYLLTDTYPALGLSVGQSGDGFVLTVYRDDLNRAAVFFRIILAIPAGVLASLTGSGYVIFLIASWFATLFTGQLPDTLFASSTALLRYQARLYAWFLMLTPTYPTAFFGDPPGPTSEPEWPAPSAGSALSNDDLARLASGEIVPLPEAEAPLASAFGGGTRIVLTSAAKAILVIALIFGILGDGARGFGRGHTANGTTAIAATASRTAR